MIIQKNPGISQSLFVIPALVRRHSHIHPKFSPVLRRALKLITITPIILLYQSWKIPVIPVSVISDPSYSEGLPEYSPRVWYAPEIDDSKFPLHILSDIPGAFQRLKYISLMLSVDIASSNTEHQQRVNRASTELQQSFNRASTEHQQRMNKDSTIFIIA